MSEKKYASLDTLSNFLDNLKGLFATKAEIHNSYYTKSEVDYVKSEIDKEVAAMNGSVSELGSVAKQYTDAAIVTSKQYADAGDTETLETSKVYADNAVAQKTQVQIITWGADD